MTAPKYKDVLIIVPKVDYKKEIRKFIRTLPYGHNYKSVSLHAVHNFGMKLELKLQDHNMNPARTVYWDVVQE